MDLDDGESSVRTADGTLNRDRIAVKRQIEMSWGVLRWSDISAILKSMDGVFFDVTYPDPMAGTHLTKSFYVGNRPAPFAVQQGNDILWNGLKGHDREFIIKANINGEEYTSAAIVEFSIENSLTLSEGFEIGTAIPNKLTIKLRVKTEIPANARIVPYLAISTEGLSWDQAIYPWQEMNIPWTGGSTEWLPLGEFFVDSREKINDVWTFTCYDKLVTADVPYISQLSYPATQKAVWDEICDRLGFTYDGSVVINPTYQIQAGPAGYSCRQVLAYIAGANGASVFVGKDGVLRFKRFAAGAPAVFEMTTADYIRVKQTNPVKSYSRVVVTYNTEDSLTYEAGSGDDNHTLKLENPFMTQTMVNNLQAQLNGFTYLPMTMEARGFPHLDQGDIIGYAQNEGSSWLETITTWESTDIPWDGIRRYSSLILHQVLSFKGGLKLSIDAPSISEQKSEFVVEGSLSQQVNKLNQDAVRYGKPYYGITHSRTEGFVVEREDHLSRLQLNSDVMDWKVDGASVLYLDALARKLKFAGTLEGVDGTFSGTIQGGSFIGGSIRIGSGFSVDSSGHMAAAGADFSGTISASVITGGQINGTTISAFDSTSRNLKLYTGAAGNGLLGAKVQGLFSVEVNGKKINDAVVINGSTYIPVRSLSESIGAGLSVSGGAAVKVRRILELSVDLADPVRETQLAIRAVLETLRTTEDQELNCVSNRYANLVGSKKISEDFNNINIGFDRVQADMDTKAAAASPALTGTPTAPTQPADDNSTKIATTQYADRAAGKVQGNLDTHIGDKVVHVTQEDHDKLDGIQEGAEVNQNAFAKVNDIEAADPSSQLFIIGGLGITITTNPNTGEVTVTATGESAPGAHGSTHTEHGADPIPTATLTEGGLLSAAQFAEIVAHGELLDEHSAAITSLEDRLDTADTNELTLQPGVQIITAQRDSRFKLGSIKGKTEINGQGRIGMIGVENPYVTRISGNLLPPFYDWNFGTSVVNVEDLYKISIIATAESSLVFYDVRVKPNTDYTLSAQHNGWIGVYNLDGVTAIGPYTQGGFNKFNSGDNDYVRIYFSKRTLPAGTYTCENPILWASSEDKPFKPHEDALLAFQTELHANPNDGSDKDELFERGGQYFKLAKWKKVVLDNTLSYEFSNSYTGIKRIRVPKVGLDAFGTYVGYGVKYDGRNLEPANISGWGSKGDQWGIDISAGYTLITILNTDSGWGDSYTPTADEIKAYFMGWKMYDTSGSTTAAYNRTDGQYKGWVRRRASDGALVEGTGTLPTTMAPEYNPYNLLFKLATPTVKPVTSEGCLTFTEGDNQIEVRTGIVLREGVKPFQNPSNGNTVINSTSPGQESSKVKYPVERFLTVYKSSLQDNAVWTHQVNDPYAYGKDRLYMTGGINYDQSAAYSVTYLKLDKSPIVPFTGSVATNEKAQLTDLTAGVQEALQRVSVVEQKKIRRYPMKSVPKVNTDGLYIEDAIVDDTFSGVVPFYADPPEPDPADPIEEPTGDPEQAEEVPEPDIAGYIIGIPVPPGLFHPHFDLAAWEAKEEEGHPFSPADYWHEALTPEEIEELTKPPEPTELDRIGAELAGMKLQTIDQQSVISSMGAELAQTKLQSIDQQQTIASLGSELAAAKLEIIQLKGGQTV
ncbi:hypothetical protein BGX30_002164 [Mortierella sp. GBA39]|nr:hypothetical protein BGX30_002164 [Mortierella sp. GBA39]